MLIYVQRTKQSSRIKKNHTSRVYISGSRQYIKILKLWKDSFGDGKSIFNIFNIQSTLVDQPFSSISTHVRYEGPNTLIYVQLYFVQQMLTKGQQIFLIYKLPYLGFPTPCRPMLCDILIEFQDALNFHLFSMNSQNFFGCYKIQIFSKNKIYL